MGNGMQKCLERFNMNFLVTKYITKVLQSLYAVCFTNYFIFQVFHICPVSVFNGVYSVGILLRDNRCI